MAAAAGGWRAAGRRRRGRAGGKAVEKEEEDGAVLLRRLREARDDLLSSGFWAASAGAVRAPLGSSAEPPSRCVCYGLGRFSGCPAARHQLAFLLLLLEELGVPPGRCSLFDPAFSAQEAAALGQLGLRLLPDNEEGKHGVEGSATLFYMVHCGKALYNNLLWRNWSAGALSKMVIIGNSFKGIEERLLSRILERDYSYIAKVLKGTEEVALPAHPRYLDTFNDTSVHWFPSQKLKELSPEVWDFVEEPTYQDCDDLEIIRKEDRADRRSPAAAES
ncbi:SRR1-like protein [Gymnogyps californianus]|uniref:SRR1-like protein n=1 Tax=Gymnogyps californianus TaxID=33616 RepID=UPI0021C6CFE0|nr:SRR1-like protein [Gymnogyps californianus]